MSAGRSALVWSRQAIVADAVARAVDPISDVHVRAYAPCGESAAPPAVLITCGTPPGELPQASLVIHLPDDGVGAAVLSEGEVSVVVDVAGPEDIAALLARYLEADGSD